GPWILAVAHTANGGESLRALFWYNLAGRFTHIAAPAAYRYGAGHPNSWGKYFIELPVYLLPWTAVAATAPFVLLLTLAATARDIYAAPALLGVSLLIALETGELQRLWAPGGCDGLRWTRLLIAAIACLLASVLVVLAAGRATAGAMDAADAAITPFEYCGSAVAVLALAGYALWRAAEAQRDGRMLQGFQWIYAAYAGAFCIAALAVFPTIDRWQDLPEL